MTTIREVAQKAGVSYATVSHVINNSRFVSEETRKRVLDAMAELNYRPNAVARSLRSGRTNTIGLMMPDSSNPFFAEIGRSIEAEAFNQGFSIILCNMELDSGKEKFYVEVLLNKQVDGIIFVATGEQVEMVQLLLSQQIPFVMIDRDLPEIDVDTIITDNRLGGYLATRHLIELGHQRIACITGPSSSTTISAPSARRVVGYREALAEAGIDYDASLVCLGDFHPQSGMEIAETLLKLPSPPTAIFACNDLMAIGTLHAAKKLGMRIPQDLSIVGFDDIELSRYINPPLTTISQPKEEIGVWATQTLAQRITSRSSPYLKVMLPTRLVVRESSAPVRQALAGIPAGSEPIDPSLVLKKEGEY